MRAWTYVRFRRVHGCDSHGTAGVGCSGSIVRGRISSPEQQWPIRFSASPGTAEWVSSGDQRSPARTHHVRVRLLASYESIEGGGEFLEERFDVNAKAATPPKPGRPGELGGLNIMMQNLLAERFGLVIRWADRLGDGYVLLRSRSEGRLGPGIRRSDFECPRTTPQPPGDARSCDMQIIDNVLTVAGHRMVDFAQLLSHLYERPVIDRTELAGWFAFQLRFNARELPRSLRLMPPRPESDAELGLPSLFTELQEELGLKLERQQVVTRVLIVEQVHALKEN